MVEELRLPETPLTVTVTVPVVAVALAVSVRTLVLVVGFVPNDAVTPDGKPEAESVTLPVKPPAGVTVIVVVPPAPPCVIDTDDGLADKLNDGDDDVPARAFNRFWPLGLPMPVARS